jgi:hypothetical protein
VDVEVVQNNGPEDIRVVPQEYHAVMESALMGPIIHEGVRKNNAQGAT